MDEATLAAYDREAAAFAQEWENQKPPTDLHQAVRRFFIPGACADIGCGSGRDTAWLNANGFAAIGYDGSAGLLDQARRRHPGLRFVRAMLPALDGVAAESFANVLCETVIMHLAPGDIGPAVERLLAILIPGGTLYLSWRVTEDADSRDPHGRLYAAFDPALVAGALAGARMLLDEQQPSVSSGKPVRRIVARKAG